MRNIFAAFALLALVLPAFAQDQTPPPADQAAPVPEAVTPAPPANPPMTGPKLLLSTSLGDITLQLDSVRAPRSVANVLRYVKERHYDGTVFYRVARGFVIQMGSFEAHGKGRGVHPGPVPLEANNGLSNLRGTAALGRADTPDSATAEFYINLADNLPLDHKTDDPGNTTGYAVFGQVIAGMDVVDTIGNVAVGDDGPMAGQAPVEPVLVKKISLLK